MQQSQSPEPMGPWEAVWNKRPAHAHNEPVGFVSHLIPGVCALMPLLTLPKGICAGHPQHLAAQCVVAMLAFVLSSLGFGSFHWNFLRNHFVPLAHCGTPIQVNVPWVGPWMFIVLSILLRMNGRTPFLFFFPSPLCPSVS